MSERDVPDLQALRCIIEHGSFVAAARQLRVSRSSLSETIRRLESRVGVQLLNRTTRSVSPTVAGERLAARFVVAFDEIQSALGEARDAGSAPAGPVRVHAQRLGYEMFLRPFLPRFIEAYPAIQVEVQIDDAPLNIVAHRFDMGIRLGELLDEDSIAVPLGDDLRQLAVASPAYLERHGTPQHPRDLLQHRCIAFRWPGNEAIYSWEFIADDAWFSVPVSGPLTFNDQRATIDAAIGGAGIAFWVESELRPFLDDNRLVAILGEYSGRFPGFALHYPRHRQRPAAVQALIDALRRGRGR